MEMLIDFPGGSRVDAHFGPFAVATDQPPASGAPTPFALFLASIGTCAGISFGFESWAVELKNGDEFYGLIVNETENEITIKDARAIPTPVKKSDIARRTQSKLSIMPAGLPQLMTQQDLVDLVEYLATLKKK